MHSSYEKNHKFETTNQLFNVTAEKGFQALLFLMWYKLYDMGHTVCFSRVHK